MSKDLESVALPREFFYLEADYVTKLEALNQELVAASEALLLAIAHVPGIETERRAMIAAQRKVGPL